MTTGQDGNAVAAAAAAAAASNGGSSGSSAAAAAAAAAASQGRHQLRSQSLPHTSITQHSEKNKICRLGYSSLTRQIPAVTA